MTTTNRQCLRLKQRCNRAHRDCLRLSLKHRRKKKQKNIVAARKTGKRKIRRTRWGTEKERMHCCDGVQPFETLKRMLRSVRDNWNKLDRWERVVHVGGFGKWDSEFQESSMILITQNVGFIYKNVINNFFILFIKITICRYAYFF